MGDRVIHATLGEGTVVSLGSAAQGPTAGVKFGRSIKTLILKFAKLTRAD